MKAVQVIAGFLLLAGCTEKEPACLDHRWYTKWESPEYANDPKRPPDCPEYIAKQRAAEAKAAATEALLDEFAARRASEYLAPRAVSPNEAQKIDRTAAFVRDALMAGKASTITVGRTLQVRLQNSRGEEVCFEQPDFKPRWCR